jgi:hypothetical protein
MPQEFTYLQQILGSVFGLGQATLMASLFIVLVFRPERIRSRRLFSLACWLFGLSVLLPPILNALLGTVGAGVFTVARGNFPGSGGLGLVFVLAMGLGPVLFGLSLLFALLALVPGPRQESPFQPPKHPLE